MTGWYETWGLLLALSIPGTEQPKPAEVLPPPRLVQPTPLVRTVEVSYGPDPYWRMRLYARDRYGYLRPRVVYTPDGAFYPLTGEPYYQTPTKGIP